MTEKGRRGVFRELFCNKTTAVLSEYYAIVPTPLKYPDCNVILSVWCLIVTVPRLVSLHYPSRFAPVVRGENFLIN